MADISTVERGRKSDTLLATILKEGLGAQNIAPLVAWYEKGFAMRALRTNIKGHLKQARDNDVEEILTSQAVTADISVRNINLEGVKHATFEINVTAIAGTMRYVQVQFLRPSSGSNAMLVAECPMICVSGIWRVDVENPPPSLTMTILILGGTTSVTLNVNLVRTEY